MSSLAQMKTAIELHPFHVTERLDPRELSRPGALDMKADLALMLAFLRAFESTSPELGYDVAISSDEETCSASSSALVLDRLDRIGGLQ